MTRRKTRRHIALETAAAIDKPLLPPKPPMLFPDSKRCQCLECGAILEVLTTAHAEKHGYSSKIAFIEAGKVKLIGVRET